MAVYLKQVHLPHLPLHSLALSSSLSLCHSYIKEALAPLLIQLEALCSHSATRFGIALYLYVFILLSCTNVGDKIVEWERLVVPCFDTEIGMDIHVADSGISFSLTFELTFPFQCAHPMKYYF